MANATDNLYVNIIANTQGFTDKMKQSLKPLNDFVNVIQKIMTMGGAAIILKQIAMQVGEMEKAYAKLHPESQKAAGSLANWNTAMADMKANQGDIVSKILTPIRAALLELIDPIGQATFELRALNAELAKVSEKYTSAATKEYKNMAEAQKALADATKLNKEKQAELSEVMRQRAMLQKTAPTDQTRMLAGQRGGEALAEQVRRYDEALAIFDRRTVDLKVAIAETAYQMAEIPKWMAEQKKGATATAPAIVAYTETVSEAFDVMQDYNAQLQASIDFMEGLRTGTKLAAEETRKIGRAMQESAGGTTGKGGSRTRATRSIGRRGARAEAEDVQALAAEWQKYADLIVSISASLGEAFVTGDYIEALRQMTTALLDFIAKEAIAAGLKMILAGNIPMGIALLAIGGITMGVGAGIRASGGGGGGGGGVELPRMASGGIVTRPTLAMIGEAGPEAVVPLGRGAGGTIIIVQGSIWQTEDLAVAVARAQARW